MLRRLSAAFVLAALALVSRAACAQDVAAPSSSPEAIKAGLQVHRIWRFEEQGGAVEIDNDFSGARVNACERVGERDYKIIVSPENEPINPSPWYAFRLRAEAEQEVRLRVVITASKARPWPYASSDGRTFTRMSARQYTGGEGAKECVITVFARAEPIWIAANHMIGVAEIDAWTDAAAARVGAEIREVGKSSAGRAIRAFEFGAKDARAGVVVIGRQHPPEVSGTVGFMRFIEALSADTETAREFRATHRVLCVPLVNPDGVHEGQWRSTLGAVDANRDWGPFTQAETRAVRDAIVAFAARDGMKLRLLLDFHATAKDILYVPPDETPLDPPHFAKDWLARIAARFPDYALDSSATNNVKEWTFKRWAFETFGAPGITYELGSATPHDSIARTVTGAADEAMKLLLARVREPAAAGAVK